MMKSFDFMHIPSNKLLKEGDSVSRGLNIKTFGSGRHAKFLVWQPNSEELSTAVAAALLQARTAATESASTEITEGTTLWGLEMDSKIYYLCHICRNLVFRRSIAISNRRVQRY